MIISIKTCFAAAIAAMALSGCAYNPDQLSGAVTGLLVGGPVGAAVGAGAASTDADEGASEETPDNK